MPFARRKAQQRKAQLKAKARVSAQKGFVVLDSRLPVAEAGRELLRKPFPEHWSFLLGELALYSLLVLIITGSYLTFFFTPSMMEAPYAGAYTPLQGVPVSEAYASVLRISFEVRGGLLIRQMHHWASLVFVAAVAVHMLRIFFTGAFRKPRESNWLIGVTLFVLAVLEGFCGYSLPDDLLSGTGLRIAQGVFQSIPVFGTYLTMFIFGGEFPGHIIISRLYALHVLFVPGAIIALVALHLVLVVYLKHTQWAGQGKTNSNVVGTPMFPAFTVRSVGLSLTVFGLLAVLGGVAQINPVYVYGPYRTDQVSTASQPDWYIGFLEGSLRIMPPFETNLWGHTVMWNVLVPAVLLPGLLFGALYAYPFIERWVTRGTGEHHLCDRPRDRVTRTGLGVAGIVFYAVLLLAGGNDVLAMTFGISLNVLTWIFRVSLVLAPIVGFLVTKRFCLALQAHDRERVTKGDPSSEIAQDVQGGMHEAHLPLTSAQLLPLLVRDLPEPLAIETDPEVVPSRRSRLRAALSLWFYRDRVTTPLTPVQQQHVTAVTAPPALAKKEQE
ncbi:cytochrome bc complex cytochrome b subunit [Streptomyces sp. NPDC051322]|uniref:cytochrome bc1 complex cytochrome b subunit n=1 Tax=Streptomyces sp. NPDC051322 TaxID=3154645 RepID=UPI00344C53A6